MSDKPIRWKFNEAAAAWAAKQVTGPGGLDRNYTLLSEDEFTIYGPHIGQPKTILDLACGVGRVAVFLHHVLADPTIQFILADSTSPLDKKLCYGWNDNTIYNDMQVTEDFACDNGMENFVCRDVRQEPIQDLDVKPDLIISMLGIGFHVPLHTCIADLHSICHEDTTLIFGVGSVRDFPDWEDQQQNVFTAWFREQNVIPFESRYPTHEGRILILRKRRV